MVTTKSDFGYPVPHLPEGSDELTVVVARHETLRLEGDVRVTMLAHLSGTRNGADWPEAGEEVTLPAA